MTGSLDLRERELVLRSGGRLALGALAVSALGWLGTIAVAVSTEEVTERFLRSYLVSFTFFLSLALGALFFVLIGHLTRAGWNVSLRRLAEVLALPVVPLAVLALILIFGRHELYEWTHSEALAADPLLRHKSPYLNTGFFAVRLAFYFVVWGALALALHGLSVRQDRSGDPELTLWMERLSAPGAIFYAMTMTFASFDFLMSLYPHWYSTIYGVYFFSGAVVAAYALVALFAAGLQRGGKLVEAVGVGHYHDLGTLMFAFVVFWAYIGFSQYMLIWYGGIPEETEWYLRRQEGPWLWLSLLLLAGHFALPFLWLLSRHPKRRKASLVAAGCWLLAMHWLDVFWLVMPEVTPHGFPFHLLDLTCFLALGGLYLAVVFWRLGQTRLLAVRDPRLVESMGLEHV